MINFFVCLRTGDNRNITRSIGRQRKMGLRDRIGRVLTATGLRIDEDELVAAGTGLDAIPESVLIREPSGGEMIPEQGILAVRS